MTDTNIAKLMWDAYAVQAGGKTFDGKPLPTWDELGEERQSCWIAAASVTADRIETLEAELHHCFHRIEELQAALRRIKEMHHDGGVNDLQERDDKTYCIVCDALDAK